jgi:ABC-type anion transport system duplicated permease subunit
MRQKDIQLILVIVFISAVISLFVSKAIFTSPKNRQQRVEVVQPITADFPPPASQYFNSSAFDPTLLITIGQGNNTNPFNSTNNAPSQ